MTSGGWGRCLFCRKVSMGDCAEGLAHAESGVRTHISISGNLLHFPSMLKKNWRFGGKYLSEGQFSFWPDFPSEEEIPHERTALMH